MQHRAAFDPRSHLRPVALRVPPTFRVAGSALALIVAGVVAWTAPVAAAEPMRGLASERAGDSKDGPTDKKAVKLDQLSVRSKRDGSVQVLSGLVTANGLDQVVVQVGGKDTKFESDLVLRITWGDVPSTFKDGRTYFGRDQFADAAAQFRLAAGDSAARDVVRASARLWAAQSLLRWGSSDPLHFSEAAEEAAKFLSDHPSNRDVPEARALQARAKWLAGQTADAAQAYKSLFAEWKAEGATAGYRRELCFEAGLNAARALLAAAPPDTLGARELYSSLDRGVGAALADLDANAPGRARLMRLQDEAQLGDGFAELAAGNAKKAASFFQAKLSANGISDTLRHGASFGLAQALAADGKSRDAQLLFATVSALDHSDRDRAAAAQVALAEVGLKLADPDATPQARLLLETVVKTQGDTLAAAKAREMLKKL